MYDVADCVPDRLMGLPRNASLLNLFHAFAQRARRLLSYDDQWVYRFTPEFVTVKALYDYDLREGPQKGDGVTGCCRHPARALWPAVGHFSWRTSQAQLTRASSLLSPSPSPQASTAS